MNVDILKKRNTLYGVKADNSIIKDVDTTSRITTGLYNSYFYVDSDDDVLIPGCAKKSIKERGPDSMATAKIKHLKDHDFSQNVARILTLDEREVEYNGMKVTGIYHESYYPKTTLGNDMLINVSEGIYDNRSIGFKYQDLEVAVENPDEYFDDSVVKSIKNRAKRMWDKYFPQLINPQDVRMGRFWVVKEIKLFEGSDVAFGANSLTPLLGVKGTEKGNILKTLQEKQDQLMHTVKTGYQSDLCLKELEVQMLQIKQLQKELSDIVPSIKSTHETVEPPKGDDNKVDIVNIINDFKI